MGKKKSRKTVAEVRSISDGRAKKRKYQTIPLEKKREMKVLAEQGFGLSEVRKKLNVPYLPKQTFFSIKKKSWPLSDSSVKSSPAGHFICIKQVETMNDVELVSKNAKLKQSKLTQFFKNK